MSPPRRPSTPIISRDFWRGSYWAPPDTVLASAGAAAERAVGKARLLVVTLLAFTPAIEMARRGTDLLHQIGAAVAFVGLLIALLVHIGLRRTDGYRPWTPFATSALDVTLVSLALWAYAKAASPEAALNSKATFDIYYLAVVAASLRYDRRACVAAGMLAMVEYIALAFWAVPRQGHDPTYGPVLLGDQVARVLMLVAVTGLSAEIVRRAGRLQYLSTRDRLTGLVNRGFFDNQAEAELARARRYGTPMSVAMLDVDFFKKFNDTYGHDIGDAVLRLVAATLGDGVRSSDLAARYGGEEFVLLLPETDRAAAHAQLERLRAAIADAPMELPPRDGPRGVTVSAGVATYPDDGDDAARLLLRADERLYAAKQAGRNRVVSGDGRA